MGARENKCKFQKMTHEIFRILPVFHSSWEFDIYFLGLP